ncbi:hypothetical protein CP532_5255 [Ophiocordyceps camponoti-leonardi (nom. inval.)]|nr:hypothetical protein CP532_5255 [Ophiocordyceps camponoti-leonardi (nom. inval.)]
MSTEQLLLKPSCRLTKPEDWTAWWNDLVDTAEDQEVWDLINPEGTKTLKEPEEPPVPSESRTTRSASADSASSRLTASQQFEEYKEITLPRYERQLKKYKEQKKALKTMNAYIKAGASAYQSSFNTARTPREKLQKLRLKVWPGDWQEKDNAEATLTALFSKDIAKVDLIKWIGDTLDAFELCENVKSALYTNENALQRFLNVISDRYSSFANPVFMEVNKAKTAKQPLPQFRDVVLNFRLIVTRDLKKPKAVAFVNIDNNDNPPTHTLQGQDREGRSVRFSDSPAGSYGRSNDALGRRNAQHIRLQEDLLQKVRNKVSRDPETKKKVEEWKRERKGKETETSGVFMASASTPSTSDQMLNWVLLDGGASSHVFNAPEWFDSLDRTKSKPLTSATDSVTSSGVGSVTLVTETGYKIQLRDVAFFPEFNTNVATATTT